MRYALAFAFAQVQEAQTIWNALFRGGESVVSAVVRKISGRQAAFEEALSAFYRDRNADYKKYGNDALFEVT